jgi:molecular chaperone DnaJ
MCLQLRGQGELGEVGSPRGNLRILVKVREHPTFERRHNDLYCRVVVTEAALREGGEIEVPTLDGTGRLRIPRGTYSGDLLRMGRLGMPDLGGRGRGDLFVEVAIGPPGG